MRSFFSPTARLKLRTVYTGAAPAGVNYRFQLTYRREEKHRNII
jgi:hypothetical protein